MRAVDSIAPERLPNNINAELRGLLEDPMTHLIMARDGVELEEVLRLVREARAVRNWRGLDGSRELVAQAS